MGSVADWVSAIAAVVSVIVTVIIAFVVLLWPRIEHRRWNRRLRLELRSPVTFKEDIGKGVQRFVHLRVRNDTLPVHNVRVFIRKIVYTYSKADLPIHPLPTFETGPVPLKWQFNHAKDAPKAYTVGMERFCDLGFVRKNDSIFFLETDLDVANLTTKVPLNIDMKITLTAEGDDGVSPPLIISLKWDGVWVDDDDEMTKHLQVREETHA